MIEMSLTLPLQNFKGAINKKVIVKLKNGNEYHGVLKTFDQFMNLTLENASEYVEGELSTKYGGTLFLRGNNILYVRLEVA